MSLQDVPWEPVYESEYRSNRTLMETGAFENALFLLPAGLVQQSPSALSGADETPYDWEDWCAIRIATLRGDAFNEASYLIESTFSELSLDPQIICTGDPASVNLPEAAGVRLSIAFRAMKPIRRRDRLRKIAKGIDQMSLGECYYWHAKARSPSSASGTKALRVLLADHT